MKNIKKFDPENWDWYAFLASDEKTKVKHAVRARDKSGSWVTCACGQLCSSLPRSNVSGPVDSTLNRLGVMFFEDIENECWKLAKHTLDKIEERTSYLLKLQSKNL